MRGELGDESEGNWLNQVYYFNGQRVAMRRVVAGQPDVVYLVGDHLGTTSVVLNADGTLHGQARHYPYGGERWASGTLPTDYRFTGQKAAPHLGGLYHMGARFYDSYLNRFISPDSIIPQPANPANFNRYAYCLGNPLKYIDDSGHIPIIPILLAIAVGATIYDWLAHPDVVYAPTLDMDLDSMPPSDLPDNDMAICSYCYYAEHGQLGPAALALGIEVTPFDVLPGANAALRKVFGRIFGEVGTGSLLRVGRSAKKEIDLAGELADMGFDVVLHGSSKKGADALINGVQAEFKQLDSATVNAVYQNIRAGRNQSSHIIVDGRAAGLNLATAQGGLDGHSQTVW